MSGGYRCLKKSYVCLALKLIQQEVTFGIGREALRLYFITYQMALLLEIYDWCLLCDNRTTG